MSVDGDDVLLKDLADGPVATIVNEDKKAKSFVDMIDVLQIIGVDPVCSLRFACSLNKSDHATFMEIYGQGRIVQMANNRRDLNMQGLDALDLRTNKPSGEAWDFRKKSDRQEAENLVRERRPMWLIGSPPCTAFSSFNQGPNFA